MAENLLKYCKTCKPLRTDATSNQKTNLIAWLKKLKIEKWIEERIYRNFYLKGAGAPVFHGLPRIHKKNIPLKAIGFSKNMVVYGVDKELARLLNS